MQEAVTGFLSARFPVVRRSWPWSWKWIILPAQMNRRALNKAWVIKWNRARSWRPSPRAAIITPSWLNVDRAMIFLRSVSIVAAIPAINIVMVAINRRSELNQGVVAKKL